MTTRAKSPAAKRKQLATLIAGVIAVLIVLGAAFLINKLGANDAAAPAASSAKASTGKTSSAKPTPASSGSTPSSSASAAANSKTNAPANPSKLPVIKASQLPKEGQQTLALIGKGGPYPYDRDDINFGNFEGVLPKQPGGYYREFTVPTPGASNRGAKRIIVGKSGEKYYTDDHYASFSFIQEDQ